MKEQEAKIVGMVDGNQEENIVVEVKKEHKLVKKYQGLKTWQKVAVIVTGTAIVAGAGYGIYRLVSADTGVALAEAVAETAAEGAVDVINF